MVSLRRIVFSPFGALALALALVLALALALTLTPSALAATVKVDITKAGFLPDPVKVNVGDTVTWTNTDPDVHQVVANNGAFTSPVLATGDRYSFTFTTPGKVNYRDAYEKKLRGSVEVSGPPSITIVSNKPALVRGNAAILTGKVSSGAAGENVTVFATAHGQTSSTNLGTVTTTDGGAWSMRVKPKKRTSYEARWKGATSTPLIVKVRPKIGFVIRNGYFITQATPLRPGKVVDLQRWSVSLDQWISVKKVTLNTRSRKKFRWTPRAGDYKVRIFMAPRQSGPGLLAGWSRNRIYVR